MGIVHKLKTLLKGVEYSKSGISKPVFMCENDKYAAYDIGKWSYGWPSILHYNCGSNLKIGKFCCISKNVVIMLGGEHYVNRLTTYHFELMFPELIGGRDPVKGMTRGDVIIGNDVWIGHGAFIRSGVNIGDGAIIGAHAVVTKDIPQFAIVVGNPGKVIRYRFSEDTCKLMSKLAWWDWPIEKINQSWPLLQKSSPKGLVDFAKEYGLFRDE